MDTNTLNKKLLIALGLNPVSAATVMDRITELETELEITQAGVKNWREAALVLRKKMEETWRIMLQMSDEEYPSVADRWLEENKAFAPSADISANTTMSGPMPPK